MKEATGLIADHVGTLGVQYRCSLRMSLLINLLTKCWMVDDTSLSDNDFVILIVYLVVRLEIPRMSCMSTPLFDTRLIGLEVSDLVQSVIESCNQSYEGY